MSINHNIVFSKPIYAYTADVVWAFAGCLSLPCSSLNPNTDANGCVVCRVVCIIMTLPKIVLCINSLKSWEMCAAIPAIIFLHCVLVFFGRFALNFFQFTLQLTCLCFFPLLSNPQLLPASPPCLFLISPLVLNQPLFPSTHPDKLPNSLSRLITCATLCPDK